MLNEDDQEPESPANTFFGGIIIVVVGLVITYLGYSNWRTQNIITNEGVDATGMIQSSEYKKSKLTGVKYSFEVKFKASDGSENIENIEVNQEYFHAHGGLTRNNNPDVKVRYNPADVSEVILIGGEVSSYKLPIGGGLCLIGVLAMLWAKYRERKLLAEENSTSDSQTS